MKLFLLNVRISPAWGTILVRQRKARTLGSDKAGILTLPTFSHVTLTKPLNL